jgi:hypothetical protein
MSDKYSKVICESCNSKLAEYSDFKNEIVEYQNLLYDYVSNHDYALEQEEEQVVIKEEEMHVEDLMNCTGLSQFQNESDGGEDDTDDPFEQKQSLIKIRNTKLDQKRRYNVNKKRQSRPKVLSEEAKLYRDSVIGKHPTEVETNRGGIKLKLNNYYYHKDRSRPNGEIMWRCASRHSSNPCSAVLNTVFDKKSKLFTVVDIGISAHCHLPFETEKREVTRTGTPDPDFKKRVLKVFRKTVSPDRDNKELNLSKSEADMDHEEYS